MVSDGAIFTSDCAFQKNGFYRLNKTGETKKERLGEKHGAYTNEMRLGLK
jgi:hypothetical protein